MRTVFFGLAGFFTAITAFVTLTSYWRKIKNEEQKIVDSNNLLTKKGNNDKRS